MVKLFSVPRCGRLWLLADAFPSPALCVLPALFSPPCFSPCLPYVLQHTPYSRAHIIYIRSTGIPPSRPRRFFF